MRPWARSPATPASTCTSTRSGSWAHSSAPPTRTTSSRRLLALYKSGQLLLDELISARYRLEQINEAYADLLKGGHKRGVILFDEAAA